MSEQSKFAASTLAATAWVITFVPERLREWQEKHSDGTELVAETRRLIEKKRARREAASGT